MSLMLSALFSLRGTSPRPHVPGEPVAERKIVAVFAARILCLLTLASHFGQDSA